MNDTFHDSYGANNSDNPTHQVSTEDTGAEPEAQVKVKVSNDLSAELQRGLCGAQELASVAKRPSQDYNSKGDSGSLVGGGKMGAKPSQARKPLGCEPNHKLKSGEGLC